MFGLGHWDILIIFLFVIVGSVFWLWMLIECALKEPNTTEKIVWVIIIALTQWLGALIYFFIRRPKRISEDMQPPNAANSGGG